MVLRLILIGVVLSSGLNTSGGQEAPSDLPMDRSEIAERIRERMEAFRRGERPDRLMKGPRPFLIFGDPRFEKIMPLIFVEEAELEKALATWAEENGLDEQAQKGLQRRVERMRERMENQAMAYAEDKGLAIDDANRDAFLRRFWDAQIAAEQEVRREAERQLQARRETIDRQMADEFGAVDGER